MKKITTISIRPETRKKLASCGTKGQTYDELILKIIEKFARDIT